MTAKEKRLDKRARQSEQQNKVENENRQMENNTEKYQECHEETTQIHEGDKQRKDCARMQETKMETVQKHKNQDIKTFISEIISQAISMSVTKSCEQNKVKAIECPMKNAKQRCKKCWISHTPSKKWCSKEKKSKFEVIKIAPLEKVTIINGQMLQLDGAMDLSDSEEVESDMQLEVIEDMFEYRVKVSIIIVGAIMICAIFVMVIWAYKQQKKLKKKKNETATSVMEMEAQHEEPEHKSSNQTTTLENTEEEVIKRKKKTEGGQDTSEEKGLLTDPCLGNIIGPDDDLSLAINLLRGFDKTVDQKGLKTYRKRKHKEESSSEVEDVEKQMHMPEEGKKNKTDPHLLKKEGLKLRNVRNSCFINSALQLLYSVEEFRNLIISGEFLTDYNEENGPYPIVFKELMEIFLGNTNTAEDLRRQIVRANQSLSKFNSGSMEDSEEFLVKLFDILEKEYACETLNKFKGDYITKRFFLDTENGSCSSCGQFPGTDVIQPFFVLSLNMPDNHGALNDMVNNDFGHYEPSLSYQAKCSTCCKCPEDACLCSLRPVNSMKLLKTPPVYLIIKLERYRDWDPNGRKNNSFIYSENELKFRGMNKTFELSAIIDHIGQTQFSGHWKMHKKLTTWTTCNDDMILNNISESKVKTINNTIFLYSLKGEMEDKQDLERSATDFIDFPPDKNQTTTVTDSSNPTTTVENTQEDVIKRKKKTKRGQYTLVEEGLSIDPCLGNIFGIPDDDLFHAINLFRGFDKKWPYGDFHPLCDYKKGSKFCLFCLIRSSVSRLNNINPAKKGKDLKPMEICSMLSMIRSVLKELFSEQKFFLYFLREIFSEKTQTVTLQQAICGQMGNVLREALESYGDLSSGSDMQVLAFEFPDQCSVEIEYFISLGGV